MEYAKVVLDDTCEDWIAKDTELKRRLVRTSSGEYIAFYQTKYFWNLFDCLYKIEASVARSIVDEAAANKLSRDLTLTTELFKIVGLSIGDDLPGDDLPGDGPQLVD
ncbi:MULTISPECIES: hypothetical protein [unclassified Mesorhizobium]|uniref:hypothetical protein n=1 Tax=unclassified Mesorhizobium TaxID=325217 RepID=UPI00112C9396|nr:MULTISPECIES: hypothetical protein [unclassified Mesorhizobium]MBZ9701594.1 hypothetical protein [Mesorhizobium sp. CO1-1-3]MBZ9949204.1 hypothetical protein [Mesorhizobium sp. BR1-1-11]TPI99598.1 hypothetical protein FJ428_21950 [Mesorhizobium sp. B2-8-1]